MSQINCHPILKWNAAELYTYLLAKGIFFNAAYRHGLSRVGCMVCPMSSSWSEGIGHSAYKDEVQNLVEKVEDFAIRAKSQKEAKRYVEDGGWKARVGGRGLANGGERVFERIENNRITFTMRDYRQNWLSVACILGTIVENNEGKYTQIINGKNFVFTIDKTDENVLIVSYYPYSSMDRFLISRLRGIASKVSFCIGCKTCMVKCPTGAFIIQPSGAIAIRENLCIHCSKCIDEMDKGCLVADNLKIQSGGSATMKNLDPYRGFGFRQEWLAHFIEEGVDCFNKGIISAVDYNPDGYLDEEGNTSEETKLFFLRRLLPFMEKRVNLIELAPKGTGKSYVFEKISKRGWLISGGTVSRASLIYDNARKTGGLLTRFDYVGFDEVQSITFENPGQIQQALKHYMEFGEIKGFDAMLTADAGVIVLGNIDADRFDINKNMVEHISEVFGESATLDRFHGFIPGWKIPRLTTGLIAKGWAINTEYFAEVLHALRDDLSYASVVDAMLEIPSKADKRHTTAIKRICTAFLKLLFPHVQSPADIDREDFIHYCLEPAMEMRGVIYKQLCIIDPKEYAVPSKAIPEITCKL